MFVNGTELSTRNTAAAKRLLLCFCLLTVSVFVFFAGQGALALAFDRAVTAPKNGAPTGGAFYDSQAGICAYAQPFDSRPKKTSEGSVCAYVQANAPLSVTLNGHTLSGGELAILVLVGIFGGAAFVALLLFLLLFPVINKLFGTHIPCIGMFDRDYIEDGDVAQSPVPKGRKSKRDATVLHTREKNNRKVAAAKRRADREKEKAAVAGDEGYTDDRYVKTVRIDTLYNPNAQTAISPSQIDRAMREKSSASTRTHTTPTAAARRAAVPVTKSNTADSPQEDPREKYLETRRTEHLSHSRTQDAPRKAGNRTGGAKKDKNGK